MDQQYKLISRAIQLVELGKFQLAIDLIEENFNTLEELGPMHQMLALCYFQSKDYEKAILALNTALENHPQDANNHLLLGAVYSAKGKIDLAISSLKTSLELSPDMIDAHVGLARIYLLQEKTRLAKVHIDHAINIDPNDEQVLHIKSVFEKLLGLNEESKATLLKGLEINPFNKSLLFEKANRDLQGDSPANAQEIYEQLILENPGNFILEQKIIESRLSAYWLYRNLLFKFRVFQKISYLTALFVFAGILFGGILYSSLDTGSLSRIVWKHLLIGISVWSGLFWIGRLITHSWMSNKIWNKPISYYFNPYNASSLYLFSTFVIFIYFLNQDSLRHLAIAIFLALFSLIFLGFILIEKKSTRVFYAIWFGWLHLVGIVTLVYSSHEFSGALLNKLIPGGDLLTFSILIPFAVVIFYIGGKGLYDDWKAGRLSQVEENEVEEQNAPKWHSVLYVGVFILFLSLNVSYRFIGQNVLNPVLFYTIWVLIPLGVLLYFYKSGKISKWYLHHLSKLGFDINYVSAFFLISVIFYLMFFVVIGFLTVNFIVFDKDEIETKLISNGMLQEDQEAFLLVEYKGYTERIRPRNIGEFPSVNSGEVTLKVHNSLFGVTMVDSVFLVEAALNED